jgi:hypothetical protein
MCFRLGDLVDVELVPVGGGEEGRAGSGLPCYPETKIGRPGYLARMELNVRLAKTRVWQRWYCMAFWYAGRLGRRSPSQTGMVRRWPPISSTRTPRITIYEWSTGPNGAVAAHGPLRCRG